MTERISDVEFYEAVVGALLPSIELKSAVSARQSVPATDGDLRQVPPPTQFTRFCTYCGTRLELPPGTEMRTERTADICPPARVAVYGLRPDQRVGRVEDIVHYCERGVTKPFPISARA